MQWWDPWPSGLILRIGKNFTVMSDAGKQCNTGVIWLGLVAKRLCTVKVTIGLDFSHVATTTRLLYASAYSRAVNLDTDGHAAHS